MINLFDRHKSISMLMPMPGNVSRKVSAALIGSMVLITSQLVGAHRLSASTLETAANQHPEYDHQTAEVIKQASTRSDISRYAQRAETSLQKKLTIDLENVTLKQALAEIMKKVGVRITYSKAVVPVDARVSVKGTNIPLHSALDQALKGMSMQVKLVDSTEVVIVREEKNRDSTVQETKIGTIAGTVTARDSGDPIGGVTITVVGSNLKAVTDAHGQFKINGVTPGTYSIAAKLLGYASTTQSVTVNNGEAVTVRFSMDASTQLLTEVVTTVTGQQKKLEIGNDITTINVEEVMKQAPITSVTDLLEGRVPGLTVMRTSGVPGAPSRIRLRGIGGGLLSGEPGAPTNDPIVIVDGIRIYAGQTGVDDQKLGGGKYPTPSPIDQIDPNSIDKIEVLRGPSAAAMYGADAGDGVIIITTKQGKAGRARWDVGISRGFESMAGGYAAPGYYRFGHPPRGTDQNAIISAFCPSFISGAFGPLDYLICDVDSVVRFQALNEPRLSTLGRGTSTRVNGTASGGSKDLTYSVTGSITNSLGLTKMPPLYQDLFRILYDSAPSERMRRPTSLDSKSGQASFSGEFGHGLTAIFTTSLSQSIQHQSSANDQLANLASVYIDTNNISPGRPGQYAYQLDVKNNSIRHALAINLRRWAWFPISGTLGIDRQERNAQGLTPRGIFVVVRETWNRSYSTDAEIELSKGLFTERNENIATRTGRINGTLFPRSRISVSIGSEITQRSNSAIEGESDTLVEGVSSPSKLVLANRSERTSTTGGWFLEPRLNMHSRFFVNPGFRLDGGGVSGSRGGFRGGLLSLFPKLNFSWIAIDRESREPLFGAISLLRPRLAFGIAGVQPAAEWSLRTLEQHTGNWDPGSSTIAPDYGLRLRSVGNTKLGPEKTQEVEGGFDIQLWETRLTVSATGFYKMRKNAILKLPLAPSVGAIGQLTIVNGDLTGITTGSLSYYTNIGHVRNTGAEISLNAMVLDLPNVGWNIDLSISKYTNKLIELFGDQSVMNLGNGTRLVEGYPLFGRWSRPISGWTIPANGAKLWYGDYAVADSSVYMGMQAPDFEMPFRTSFTLLRGLLTVHGQFHYKAGLTQQNLGSGVLLGNNYNNPNATYAQQAYALAASCLLQGFSSAVKTPPGCTDYGFIQKINSLRFNSLSIGYNVPRESLKRFPVSSLSLSLQGNNLGLWTNYRGKDPDVNGNLIGDVTVDSGQLPTPRTWTLQIRIGT